MQSKLLFSRPLAVPAPPATADGESEEKLKPKRRRKSQPRTPKKSSVTSTEACGLKADIPETKLTEEHDKEQEDAVSEAGNNKCSKSLDAKTSGKNRRRMKNKQMNECTPEKVEASCQPDPKEPNSQQKVNKRSSAKKNLDGKRLHTSPPVPDLRLEAKLAAEENVRLSAGKQIHPFFTCSKPVKRVLEVSGLAKTNNRWSVSHGDSLDSCPPIHVFDPLGDDVVSLDWKNWVFMDRGLLNTNGSHMLENAPSVFEGSVEPLKLDTITCDGMHLDKLSEKVKRNHSTPATTIPLLLNGQGTLDKLSPQQVHVSTSGSFSSHCASAVHKLENEEQDTLFKERFASYYRRCSYSPQCSLWTNKYEPYNALEVCGNKESIKSLSEWLKSWHERGFESNKNVIHGDRGVAEDSEDSSYEIGSDTENMDDDAMLKNVLLITGPIGCGKSAAVYACAKEQGFEVIEVNASDARNGSHIKQKYGEAMESHGFNRWSSEDPLAPKKKNILELLSNPTDIEGKLTDQDSLEIISSCCNQDLAPVQCSPDDVMEKIATSSQVANKSLILFEDVDTVFDEDRGFISTILQLAETAKRPIILTSNNKNPVLPRVLDRSVLNFTLPSPGELLPHLHMICTSEKSIVSSHLLEQLIKTCLGDIRKALMILQFWCQGSRGTERNRQITYSPLPCDVDAAHLVMPRVIPWEFTCELSKKVEEEINKTISSVEESMCFMEVLKQQDPNSTEFIEIPSIGIGAANYSSRKKRRLKRKRSILDQSEVSTNTCNLDDFSGPLESTVACARRTVRHRPGTVLSSQSDDHSDDGNLTPVDTVPNISTVPMSNDSELAIDHVCQFTRDDMFTNQSENFDTVSVSRVCDTFKLQDVSCVPESSLVSVAETRNDVCMSTAVSSDKISVNFTDFIKSIHVPQGAEVDISDRAAVEPNKSAVKFVGDACELDTESNHGNEEQGDFQDRDGEPLPSVYHFLDECSRADFSMRMVPGKNRLLSPEIESVQETWRKLRRCREDLKPHLISNHTDACSILKHTSRLTDLISESDIMFGACTPLISDALEPSRTPCVEPDAFSWYEEQFEMGSTYAQHGLCFHTNECSKIGSNLGCENTLNLAQEMLTSSKSTMALGKLLIHGDSLDSHIEGKLLREELGRSISLGRGLESELYNAVQPVVPRRLSLSLRGPAFQDYLSFMSQMSKSECSRLSGSPNKSRRRRSRASKHYLSSGSLPLSPEHLEVLARNRFSSEGCPKAPVFGGSG